MKVDMVEQKTYEIEVFLAEEAGKKWYFAVSAELPTFLAHGPTIGVLRDRVKDTILGMLSADGGIVLSVDVTPRDREALPSKVTARSLKMMPKGAVPFRTAITVHTRMGIAA